MLDQDIKEGDSLVLQSAARSGARLFFLKVLGISLGLVRVSLLAYFFGVGRSLEAFFGATVLLSLSSKFLQSGAISSVFVPVFLENQEKKREEVWKILSNLFNLATLMACLLWLALFSASPWIARGLVPGFDSSSQDLVVNLFRILSPVIILSLVSSLIVSILNASKKFGLPQWIGILSSLIDIGLIALLVSKMGIFALAVGMLIGNLVECILLIGILRRMGYKHQWTLNLKDPVVRELARLVYPFFLRMGVFQATSFFTVGIISFLPSGSYAIYRYASDLIGKLSSLLIQPIGTVAYTYITEETARFQYEEASRRLSRALKMTFLVTVAPTLILLLTSKQITSLLLNRGSFDPSALIPLASALSVFGLGLFLNGAFDLFSKTLISLKRTFALNLFSMIQQCVILLLVLLFSQKWGLLGAVWASPLSTLIGISFLGGVLLVNRFPIIHPLKDLDFLKIAFAAITAYVLSLIISQSFLNGSLDILKIAIICLFFGTIYFVTCWIVRLDEFKLLVRSAFRF